MENVSTLLTAVLPLLGVVVGAGIHYWVSKASEAHKHLEELRTEAYVDFIRGVSGVAIAQKRHEPAIETQSMVLLADAKARVSVYGSKAVVESLAEFIRRGAVLDSPERMRTFVSACQKMRNESLPANEAIVDREMSQLMLGVDL
jgi:hypothetical protein